MKTVWIIGGLWPETTAEFYLDIVFNCQEKKVKSMPGIIIASEHYYMKLKKMQLQITLDLN